MRRRSFLGSVIGGVAAALGVRKVRDLSEPAACGETIQAVGNRDCCCDSLGAGVCCCRWSGEATWTITDGRSGKVIASGTMPKPVVWNKA